MHIACNTYRDLLIKYLFGNTLVCYHQLLCAFTCIRVLLTEYSITNTTTFSSIIQLVWVHARRMIFHIQLHSFCNEMWMILIHMPHATGRRSTGTGCAHVCTSPSLTRDLFLCLIQLNLIWKRFVYILTAVVECFTQSQSFSLSLSASGWLSFFNFSAVRQPWRPTSRAAHLKIA